MIHYVSLTRAPVNLEIPAALQERFWYDAARQALAFDGAMSKQTFDQLRPLSRDFEYQRALERLFQVAVPDAPPSATPGRRTWIGIGGAIILLVVAGVCLVCRS